MASCQFALHDGDHLDNPSATKFWGWVSPNVTAVRVEAFNEHAAALAGVDVTGPRPIDAWQPVGEATIPSSLDASLFDAINPRGWKMWEATVDFTANLNSCAFANGPSCVISQEASDVSARVRFIAERPSGEVPVASFSLDNRECILDALANLPDLVEAGLGCLESEEVQLYANRTDLSCLEETRVLNFDNAPETILPYAGYTNNGVVAYDSPVLGNVLTGMHVHVDGLAINNRFAAQIDTDGAGFRLVGRDRFTFTSLGFPSAGDGVHISGIVDGVEVSAVDTPAGQVGTFEVMGIEGVDEIRITALGEQVINDLALTKVCGDIESPHHPLFF